MVEVEPLILKDLTVYAEDGVITHGFIEIEKGRIVQIGDVSELPADTGKEVRSFADSEGMICVPGFVDGHIHGADGADTMDGTPSALDTMTNALPREGTTSFLATTMTQDAGEIKRALENAGSYIGKQREAGVAEVLGIHLEGPFISPEKPGAQPSDAIIQPDVALFDEWQALSNDQIRLVTVAPEEDGGMDVVRHLVDEGIIASIGHSNATYEQVIEAVNAGASRVTHLYNGMRGLHHREPGVAGAAFLHDELLAEVIADGIHSRPEMVNLAYREKGRQGLTTITDAMRAKCLNDGTYDLGGQDVTVQAGEARLANGSLAGSILEMDQAIRNLMDFTGCSLEDVVQMASENTARQLGVFDRKGSLKAGKDADFVILDESYRVMATFCRGKEAEMSRGVDRV